eukprot:CAMPEP_0172675488 /NCGR_PEP_ID=MMETSP1074-20121228/13286_1 /TAXON_ID=2916 /ORGANISM="Ceratium fusus, Strain PA161109" /LENGTH=53 /DNA_ID=CAMNT_0013492943 /DNA_START=351 /DNA_END=512 /DNA_ORIENTATION=-
MMAAAVGSFRRASSSASPVPVSASVNSAVRMQSWATEVPSTTVFMVPVKDTNE